MSQGAMPGYLGPPDLKVGGFQLWVHGREFPEADDSDDGTRVRVTLHCGASGASVWVRGAVLMVKDVAGFGDQCAAMLRQDSDSALLDPVEPALELSLQTIDPGQLRARVEISPDPLAQSHRMEFDLDQRDLAEIVEQCAAIVQEYPPRGTRDQGARNGN